MKITHLIFASALSLAAFVPLRAAPTDEIVVEALVDGGSEFHVRAEAVWWETDGTALKPGKWSGQDQPTYINGAEWMPHWRDEKKPKGKDKSAPYAIGLKTIDLEFELLAVTHQRGGTGIESRGPVTAKHEGGHFVVRIPDPPVGARWYKFVLRKKKP